MTLENAVVVYGKGEFSKPQMRLIMLKDQGA